MAVKMILVVYRRAIGWTSNGSTGPLNRRQFRLSEEGDEGTDRGLPPPWELFIAVALLLTIHNTPISRNSTLS